MKWLWRKVVSKMLAVETGHRWFVLSDSMEGGVVVFSKMVKAHRSMECLRHSIQARETWGPQDVDDEGAGSSSSSGEDFWGVYLCDRECMWGFYLAFYGSRGEGSYPFLFLCNPYCNFLLMK